jgi:hypothetical protein
MEIPSWLKLVLLLVLGIPRVNAFPFHPPVPTTISTSFRFPSLSLGDGIRNIHTLELLETIGKDYFKIHHVSQPVRYGEFVTVSLKCAVHGHDHTIFVLSHPDQTHISTLVCLRDNIQRAAFTLKATRSGKVGHFLSVESTYFCSKRVLDRDLRPLMRFLIFFEDKTRRQPELPKTHPNLLWYRRMVLGLSQE